MCGGPDLIRQALHKKGRHLRSCRPGRSKLPCHREGHVAGTVGSLQEVENSPQLIVNNKVETKVLQLQGTKCQQPGSLEDP